MVKLNNEIKFNNETIKNIIIDALDKMEKGIEINEVDRNELINLLLKYGDRDFGIKNKDTGKYYTEEELQYSVYIHIVNENNKCYIGQTSMKPKYRWGCDGNGYKGQLVYRPIEKYGWDNISHIVLCHGLSQEQANEMEVALISLFKSNNRDEFGYNVSHGGNTAGKHSEESKKKISEARKGKQHSEESKNKMSEAHKGKQHSEESKNKIGEAHKGEKHHMYGKHHSEETKNKMSESLKGENNPMYGKHLSDETKKKLSEANKGKHHSEESKNKMSEARKGKYLGEKNPMYGKHHSEESKNKMSEARKGGNNPKAKKVYCNGVIFQTAKECSEYYNVNYNTMKNWLQGKRKTPSEFIELGLRYATEEDINTYPLYIEEEQTQQYQQD